MVETLYAMSQQGGAQQQGGGLMAFLPFLLILLIIYFLMMRPQMKKQKEKQAMLNSLQPGDEIMTIGGIYGKIEGIQEKEGILIVKIAKDVKIYISRTAVSNKVDRKIVK